MRSQGPYIRTLRNLAVAAIECYAAQISIEYLFRVTSRGLLNGRSLSDWDRPTVSYKSGRVHTSHSPGHVFVPLILTKFLPRQGRKTPRPLLPSLSAAALGLSASEVRRRFFLSSLTPPRWRAGSIRTGSSSRVSCRVSRTTSRPLIDRISFGLKYGSGNYASDSFRIQVPLVGVALSWA